jgi:CDP-glucose 4,6-dehydratase
MFGEAYSGRRVFVTGHTGFKGSWLSYWLTRLGAVVTGYALSPPTRPSLFDALRLDEAVRHVVADVRDEARLAAEMAAARPEVVFHLAAQPLVREGYAHPVDTFAANVMGAVNVLEAARSIESLGAVVVVTSDKCYRNPEDGRPFTESDAMGGRDPYSASKGCAELVTAAYGASFFAAGPAVVASARAGNVIGGGDWAPDRLVPDCVRALTAGEPVTVRHPDAVRPWQHVLEPLAGYLALGASLLAEGRAFAGPWNFGPSSDDCARPVHWMVESFLEAWGAGSWTTPDDERADLDEARSLSLDSGKAREHLGWWPVWDAPAAVRRAAAWYRDYYEAPGEARRLVDEDLRAYEDEARPAGLAWARAAAGR